MVPKRKAGAVRQETFRDHRKVERPLKEERRKDDYLLANFYCAEKIELGCWLGIPFPSRAQPSALCWILLIGILPRSTASGAAAKAKVPGWAFPLVQAGPAGWLNREE